jgi:peptidoglycan biosynthesis protein MviN/MurJ (putative lipid II flippase)
MVQRSREAGLGAANSLSAAFNTFLLFYALRRKLAHLNIANLKRTLFVLVPAAALSGIIAMLLFRGFESRFGHSTLTLRMAAVFLPAAVAGVIYAGLAVQFKVPAATEMFQLIVRRFRRGN